MLAITERLVAELDVLYGLYLLALDQARKLEAEDEDLMGHHLEVREKVLLRTTAAAAEASRLLREFEMGRNVPAVEHALVEEKRRMILDVTARLQLAETQVMRSMHSRMSALRRELARQSERRDAIRAYIKAPTAAVPVPGF